MKPLRMRTLFTFAFLLLYPIQIYAQAERPGTPDPLRFEQEIAEFVQWDAKNSSPVDAILFTGSSSIRFWDTAQAFSDRTVINRGFGGSHISDMLFYYERIIGRFSPSLIVLYCGENDIASGAALFHVFEDYLELIELIRQDFPDIPVLYISIKPSSSRIEHTERFAAFNRMVQSHNRSNPDLYYIDLATSLTRNGSPDDSYFIDDLLHLNNRGYELWNERLSAFLSQLEEEGAWSGSSR